MDSKLIQQVETALNEVEKNLEPLTKLALLDTHLSEANIQLGEAAKSLSSAASPFAPTLESLREAVHKLNDLHKVLERANPEALADSVKELARNVSISQEEMKLSLDGLKDRMTEVSDFQRKQWKNTKVLYVVTSLVVLGAVLSALLYGGQISV